MDEWWNVRYPVLDSTRTHMLRAAQSSRRLLVQPYQHPHDYPEADPKLITNHRYLKHIDTYPPAAAYITAFLTPSGARFLLLHQPPHLPAGSTGGLGSSSLLGASGSTTRASTSSVAANPTSPQTEEAVRQFMNEIYESYVKTAMSPFYKQGMEIRSPVFRTKVTAAGKKWL